MESRPRRIQRSKVLNHSLGGGVGLLREQGLTNGKSHQSNAWWLGLRGMARLLPAKPVPRELINLVHDEAMQSIIIGSKSKKNTYPWTEM